MKVHLNWLIVILTILLANLTFTLQWELPSDLSQKFSSKQCTMCRFSVSLINYALRTKRGHNQVHKIANTYCQVTHIEPPLVCSNITQLFNREIVKVLSYGIITPDQVCGFLSNNSCGSYNYPMGEWEVNLDASIHLDHEELHKKGEAQKVVGEARKPYRVIHISDTHVDTSYQAGTISNCQEPLCCRQRSTKRPGQLINEAGHWGSYDECDIPMRTFESALEYLNETINSDKTTAYVIWTGDIQPHNVWEQNRKSALETFEAVFSAISRYLPNVKIFPTFGNHEMVPVDSFSPSNLLEVAREDSPEWLYKKFDAYWSRWLPSSTLTTITKDGFYAVSAQPGLKVISLNTNFCHSTNFWLYINSTDPGHQLQWLVHELQLSELEHEQVHIIGHIPPGSSDCLKVWSKNYNRIIRRFAKTVTGQFFGHTHNNEFEVFYKQDGSERARPRSGRRRMVRQIESQNEPISVAFIGPSITTFIGLNPSFRSYLIDPNQSFTPIDFDTHYMNLTEANMMGSNRKPRWTSMGSFSKMFHINDTSPVSMHSLLVDLAEELNTIERFIPIDSIDRFDSPTLEDINQKVGGQHGLVKLFKLYSLFNGLSDLNNRAKFDKMTDIEKKDFLCRFFTSQSNNLSFCKHFMDHSLDVSINQLS